MEKFFSEENITANKNVSIRSAAVFFLALNIEQWEWLFILDSSSQNNIL